MVSNVLYLGNKYYSFDLVLSSLSEEIIEQVREWLKYFSQDNCSMKEESLSNSNNLSLDYKWEDKTILIAEDEEANFYFLRAVLSKTKANILWAKNGKEAVDIVSLSEGKIDIILMDIKMPEVDGIEATKMIKDIVSNVPIIAQTAYAGEEERENSLSAGCIDFLPKPFTKEKLLKIISKYI